jgi:hypothetical protein
MNITICLFIYMKRQLILNQSYLQKIIKGPALIKTGSDRNVFALHVLIKSLIFLLRISFRYFLLP